MRDETDPIRLAIVRLRLVDGSEIAICAPTLDTAVRSRLAGHHSGSVELLPIDEDLRERLVRVFGPLNFKDDK